MTRFALRALSLAVAFAAGFVSASVVAGLAFESMEQRR